MLFEQLKVEFKIFLRQPLYLIFSIFFPLISLFLFGSIYSGQEFNGIDFFSNYIPGLCVIILFASSVFNIGNQVVMDRERGIYKRLSVTPVKLWHVMFIVILKAFVLAFVSFLLLLASSWLFFHAAFKSFLVFVLIFALMIVYSLIIGFSIGLIIKKIKIYTAVMMAFFFPMFMLSDATFPLSMMPEWLQKGALFNPLYHMNIILRIAWDTSNYVRFRDDFWLALSVLIGLIVVLLILTSLSWRKNK